MRGSTFMRFENIGQGLFYYGNIRLDKRSKFKFIYDCGSLSERKYLNEAIDRLRQQRTKTYDIIMVSHFDEDHVNGVARLIAGKRVRKFVLPYIDWVERLIIFIESNTADAEYISFLTDPVSFLSRDEFNIDEIYIVGGPADSPVNNDNIQPPSPSTSLPFTQKDNELQITANGSFWKLDLESQELKDLTMYNKGGIPLHFHRTPFALFVNGIWEFQFYLQERADKDKMIAFQKELEEYMMRMGLKWNDLFTVQNRDHIRGLYQKYYSNINQTSLLLYHGPLSNIVYHRTYRSFMRMPNVYLNSSFTSGTFLTGDFKMSNDNLLKDITAYFKRYWSNIGVFLVPHHGARANWNFRHPNDIDDFEQYVISAGFNRKNHPHLKVVEDIYNNCSGGVYLCNELDMYGYRVDFEY